jgi:hypothetical protein
MTYTLAFMFAMLLMTFIATLTWGDGSIAFSNRQRERCHVAVDLKHTPEVEARSQNGHFDATARSGCVPILLPMLPSP